MSEKMLITRALDERDLLVKKDSRQDCQGKNVWEWQDFKWRLKKPWELPRVFCKNVKYSWQRITKGYCDKDLWSIDYWFIKIVPDMLQQLKDTRHGSPGCLGEDYVNEYGIRYNDTCHEEWDKILDEMIFLFREMDEETCRKKNITGEEYEKTWKDLEQYQEICKDKAFALFTKWFYYLWD